MRLTKALLISCTLILLVSAAMDAQQAASSSATGVIPRLVNFSGKATDVQGRPIAGVAGITFAIYKDQYEGAPLWLETQNIQADAKGNYSVQLGATTSSGLPMDLFPSGDARWLGVTINGGQEQPRVLLLSVPYALKAADAQNPGRTSGLGVYAGGCRESERGARLYVTVKAIFDFSNRNSAGKFFDVTTSGGVANTLPLFTTATNVQSSILTQTGTTAINVVGKLNLPTTGAATASKGFASRPLDFVASSFNSATGAPVAQTFQWQAQQADNNTANPSAVLSLFYGSGTTAPAPTGFRFGPKGILGFAPGQTFPMPSGAVTDAMLANPSLTVATSSPLIGGGAVALGGTTAIGLQNCASKQILQFVGKAWMCADLAGPQGGIQEFTSSGTVTVPSGVSRLLVEMWGGGGGGGGGVGGSVAVAGGGGGAGGYTRAVVAVTPGATYNIVVGAGGSVGSSGVATRTLSSCTPTSVSGTPGENGGSSEVTDASSKVLAQAAGGTGGGAGSVTFLGLIALPVQGTGSAGGVGTSGANSISRTGGSGQPGSATPPNGVGGIPCIGSIPQPGGVGGAGIGGIGQNAGLSGHILVTY